MQDTKGLSTYRQTLRERILETAMHAFSRNGVKAVKMDDIARQLNISKRTLYEIYENKEVLLFEGVKKYHEQRLRELKQKSVRSSNVMDFLIQFYKQKAEEFRVTNPLFYSDLEKYPKVLEYLEQSKDTSRLLFLKFIERGMKDGYFRTDVEYDLLQRVFDAISRYIMEKRLYQDYPIEVLFKNIIFVTLRGVCTQKGVMVLDKFISK